VLLADGLKHLQFGYESEIHKHAAEPLPGSALCLQGIAQLPASNQAGFEHDLAKGLPTNTGSCHG
jgi:hypothetical protein